VGDSVDHLAFDALLFIAREQQEERVNQMVKRHRAAENSIKAELAYWGNI